MSNAEAQRLPRRNEVAYFVHLHLTTIRRTEPHSHRADHWLYQIEGKVRPMFVLQELSGKRNGAKWFLTLPITSKNRENSKNLVPIGNCLHADKESFVELQVHELPESMLSREKGKSPLLIPCDQMAFAHAVKTVNCKAMRGQLAIIG